MEPRSVALALGLGITMGIFPIYGPTTLFVILLAWVFHLNKPLMVACCYSTGLLKPLLIIPFLKLGEFIFQAEPMPISLIELTERFSTAPLSTLHEFSWSFLHAFVGWLVVAPFLVAVLYSLGHILVHSWQNRVREVSSPLFLEGSPSWTEQV